MWSTAIKLCTILLLVFIFHDELVDGRGGRGGGRFGGGRFSSGRYGGGRATRYRSSRSGFTRYGKYAAAAAAGYTIYGMTRYRSRYYGTRYYRTDPNICSATNRQYTYENGTTLTVKTMYFVCPYKSSDPQDAIYCCGPDGNEHCCTYWKSGKKTGAIIGIVIGVIVVIVIIVVICKYCSNRSRSHSPPATVVQYHQPKDAAQTGYYPNPGTAPAYPVASAPAQYPAQNMTSYPPNPYPVNPTPYPPAQPANPGAIGFEAAAPPSYNTATGYPTKN